MYDIRQFRPTLYLLLAMGFTGFAVSVGAPVFWLFGMAMLALNVWMIKNDRFKPLPRWLANGLTVLAAAYTAWHILRDPTKPIFPIGNFLLMLQLIKLYELRGNRDYAQLLVLSLLLMVAAAISTASLLFGLIFVVYLLVSPYACLLFHLKVETDHAKKQMGLDEKLANPMTLRQDQRYLNRSMTHLTGLVAFCAIVMAVMVFLFFPRGSGANVLTWQFRPAMQATGMSENMSMQSVARVQQNNTEIAWVKISHNGEPVRVGPIYLRGTVYDNYQCDPSSSARWTWSRSSSQPGRQFSQVRSDTTETLNSVEPGSEKWVQEFNPLHPIGVSFLLGMGGVTNITLSRSLRLSYIDSDHILTLEQPLMGKVSYTVESTGVMEASPSIRPARFKMNELGGRVLDALDDANKARSQKLDPRIAEYAARPDVSGTDAKGAPLAATVAKGSVVPPDTAEEIASNIERHLRTNFAYTLDLSNNQPKDSDVDPIVDFLYDSKKGWCEHFAGAMTTMCQSLGLRARVVSGYKVDEYNNLGGYFIARQSHAHAWVEVLVREGDRYIWKQFDPTSARDADAVARDTSTWTRFRHFIDYLEHTWANSVVAYDASTQNTLLDNVETKLVNVTIRANSAVKGSRGWFGDLTDWLSQEKYSISEGIILVLLTVMSVVAIGLISWYVWQRKKLMRRARRIGLDSMGAGEARRLARQLGFYEDLIDLLARRQILRAPHLTPLEFGHSLSFLSGEAYETIVRLTGIFYRVRYGKASLSPGRRRLLGRVVDRLASQLLTTRHV
jgi:transglutaminase-like putative cysteine protease